MKWSSSNLKKKWKNMTDVFSFESLLLGIFFIWAGYNNYTINQIVDFYSVTLYVILGIACFGFAILLQGLDEKY